MPTAGATRSAHGASRRKASPSDDNGAPAAFRRRWSATLASVRLRQRALDGAASRRDARRARRDRRSACCSPSRRSSRSISRRRFAHARARARARRRVSAQVMRSRMDRRDASSHARSRWRRWRASPAPVARRSRSPPRPPARQLPQPARADRARRAATTASTPLVPYADPAYYALRPKLAIARDAVVQLSDRAGLHPSLAPLAAAVEGSASSRCCRASAIRSPTCRISARSRSGTPRRRATNTCRTAG